MAARLFEQPNLDHFEIKQVVQVMPDVVLEKLDSLLDTHLKNFGRPQVG